MSGRKQGQRIKRCDRRTLKRDFLQSFKLTKNVTTACQSIGIHRATLYRWFQSDKAFKERYEQMCAVFWPPPRPIPLFPELDENYWTAAPERELMAAFGRSTRRLPAG